MTRYTNLGRKRSYLAAGLNYRVDEPQASTSITPSKPESVLDPIPTEAGHDISVEASSKKGRKKRQKKEVEFEADGTERKLAGEAQDGPAEISPGGDESSSLTRSSKTKGIIERKSERKKGIADRAAASERRRLKRVAERHANKICFACREMGHAAQMCPNVKQATQESGKIAVNIAGICYRCGSKKHTLSRCKKPIDEVKPLPFASCFVCMGKGHLASTCPQNKEKGVYPNGGSCKLCNETTHLARDCPMRKTDTHISTALLGTGQEAGADEDDFHTFRRKNVEVDRELQGEERVRKMAKVRAGKHSGIVKAFGLAPQTKPKKVVDF